MSGISRHTHSDDTRLINKYSQDVWWNTSAPPTPITEMTARTCKMRLTVLYTPNRSTTGVTKMVLTQGSTNDAETTLLCDWRERVVPAKRWMKTAKKFFSNVQSKTCMM